MNIFYFEVVIWLRQKQYLPVQCPFRECLSEQIRISVQLVD